MAGHSGYELMWGPGHFAVAVEGQTQATAKLMNYCDICDIMVYKMHFRGWKPFCGVECYRSIFTTGLYLNTSIISKSSNLTDKRESEFNRLQLNGNLLYNYTIMQLCNYAIIQLYNYTICGFFSAVSGLPLGGIGRHAPSLRTGIARKKRPGILYKLK